MKSKTEIIETIDPKKTYIGSYVIARINDVDTDDRFIPTTLKKSDVIKHQAGSKIRPCVIIKVKTDKVICLLLTSTENIHYLCESKSRFFGNTYFSNEYKVIEIERAKRNFIGVYDNHKYLNNAIKELKLFILKNI